MLKSILIYLFFVATFGAIIRNVKALTFVIKTNWKLISTLVISAIAAFIITFI